ncbi:hypothetical protein [Microlunatus parietis]|uniref:PH domain-containing protein n=1 Tax=Microlunatus parietis TaxID=682979 RepID=A0A7Y9LBX8_9ACTN|nr:hypothetical protein [Microlunatus parietis]NYE74279.1 hypothetical protein [Microlunatus parietis]
MNDQTGAYVIRYSASWESLALAALSVALTFSLARLAATTAEPLAWIPLPFAGGFALFLVVSHLARLGKVALRVDSHGLTFGGQPFRHRETTHTVPWTAIDAVVVYRTYLYRVQGFGPRTGRFLGLRGTEAPIILPGRPDPVTDPSRYAAMIDRLRRWVPHVPPDVAYASRRVWG